MRKNTIILILLLTPFFGFNLAFGQSFQENEIKYKSDTDTAKKISWLSDSLQGVWQLSKTIRYEKGDTIIQEPSTRLWLTPGAKAFTTIRIDSSGSFEIEQACMKCPYLFWKGHYEIEVRILKGVEFFYISFIEDRMKNLKEVKQKEEYALVFNGYITHFENGEMTIMDKEGTAWIYHR